MNSEQKQHCAKRAIELAKKGSLYTFPNPLVGAVLWKNGSIIGEGWHKYYGDKHAEANAIEDAEKKGYSVEGANMFVSLEPCTHHGKQPACTDLILKKKIKKLLYLSRDPNPLAEGGAELLKKEGVEVEYIADPEAERLNAGFFAAHKTERPQVIAKIATYQNGAITSEKGSQSIITGKESQWLTHSLRARVDGVLVGKCTALIDQPSLMPYLLAEEIPNNLSKDLQILLEYQKEKSLQRSRSSQAQASFLASPLRQTPLAPLIRGEAQIFPKRIILDPRLETLREDSAFFDTNNTIFIHSQEKPPNPPSRGAAYARDRYQGGIAKCIALPEQNSRLHPEDILQALYAEGIRTVLIEGGKETLHRFQEAKLIDQWLLLLSAKESKTGKELFFLDGKNEDWRKSFEAWIEKEARETLKLGKDTAYYY